MVSLTRFSVSIDLHCLSCLKLTVFCLIRHKIGETRGYGERERKGGGGGLFMNSESDVKWQIDYKHKMPSKTNSYLYKCKQISRTLFLQNYSVFWDVTQRRLVKNRRFRTTYRSHLWYLPLKMGPIRNPETSVPNQPTVRNIPEDWRIQVNGSGSLAMSHDQGSACAVSRAKNLERTNQNIVCRLFAPSSPFYLIYRGHTGAGMA
jgi:hypothetical protein